MKTEREKMTNAEPFLTNDPQLMEDKKKARILCSRFNLTNPPRMKWSERLC